MLVVLQVVYKGRAPGPTCENSYQRETLSLMWCNLQKRMYANGTSSDSLLRHSRSHQSPRRDTGVPHNESGARAPPLHCENEQISLSNHNYSIDRHETPTSPQQLSSMELECPQATDLRSTSYSFSNPAEQQNTLVSNVEELAQTHTNGVPGFPTPGSQSNLTEPDASLDMPSQDGPWNFGNTNTEMPAWFADDDFDISALNSEIMMSTAQWLPLGNASQWHHAPFVNTPGQPTENMTSCCEDVVQRYWYTFMGTSRTGQITPDTGTERTQVDEAYRASLAVKLQPDIPFLPLPSTDFLNLCVQMYFTKFHRVFPIVHAPTFRPSSKSSLLLLSLCSLGSLFVGSSHAASQGLKVFETLNKAILSSWERHFSRQGPETIAMVQAALIGQTFGLLSGRQKDLLIAETFHGTLVVQWARRATASKPKKALDYISLSEILDTPEKAWKKWIQAEEQNRLLAGVHVHDVEISELFLTDPYLRHSPKRLPPLSDDDLWAATTVEDWSQKMMSRLSSSKNHIYGTHLHPPETIVNEATLSSSAPPKSDFHNYLELEGLAASAIEAKNTSDPTERRSFENILINFHKLHISPNRGHKVDSYCLSTLWHSIFFSLYADINRLELAIGKEGFAEAENHVEHVRSWASSQDGQCCALHAALILRELEKENIGTEPPMHIPRIIFRAALVWFCYTRFGTDTTDSRLTMQSSALQRIGVNCQRLLFEANGFKVLRPTASESRTFSGLVDILSRAGHWGISQLMWSILNLLLPDVKDEERYVR
ncbi:uncharacterized protein N7503_006167 [Penicillium pulvis]|uniref:uncharacterized protein n=1 Tax=Penicillium pulvis TaxID=1562058 RepID=UPI002546DA6F|nr:uncharacterized protein N7503_006167 [Penicillium pulvis]KAJ5798662.1 hypothetical protein N7503_006167 [Penicillium pulvis]